MFQGEEGGSRKREGNLYKQTLEGGVQDQELKIYVVGICFPELPIY